MCNQKIYLTEKEEKIFEQIIKTSKTFSERVIPRAAGGWVRDKLLNIESHDIDIALDTVSGFVFAQAMASDRNLKVNVVKANPEKSKHLETAILRFDEEISIDFVNLRVENYTNSRIPVIRMGTAMEDALRRDLTINSLFYNLVTREVEDYSGRGLEDLRSRTIDTPLNPEDTLFDDPLRVLRIFRFQAKLGFKISSAVIKAISSTDEKDRIKESFVNKISPERAWCEISAMMRYPGEKGLDGIFEIIQSGWIKPVLRYSGTVDLEKARLFYMHAKEYCQVLDKEVVQLFFMLIPVDFSQSYEQILNKAFKCSKATLKKVSQIQRGVKLLVESTEVKNEIKFIKSIILDAATTFFMEIFFVSFCIKQSKIFLEMIKTARSNNLSEILKVSPLVRGDDLVKLKIHRRNRKKALEKALRLQIVEGLNRDDILGIILNNFTEN